MDQQQQKNCNRIFKRCCKRCQKGNMYCNRKSGTEMEILPSINYQVNSSNICQFNSIFRKICLAHIRSSKVKQSFSNVNSRLLKEFVLSGKSIGLSPVNGAIVVINATLKEFNENDMDMISAVMDIQNLNYSA